MSLDNGDLYSTSPIVALKRVLGTLSSSDLAVGFSSRLYKIERKLLTDLGETVQGGPFAGMAYTKLVTSGGCIVPKLLGCYEQELHPAISVDTIDNFTGRFSATHEVEVIQPGERNPEEFPELESLSPLDKLLAMYERFDATPWVYLRARDRYE